MCTASLFSGDKWRNLDMKLMRSIMICDYFQKMDMNRDGVVTLDEFLDCCRNDDAISQSMAVFDSSF